MATDDRLIQRPDTSGAHRHRPRSVKGGDTVTVSYNPALNGNNIGFLRSITLPDKKEVEFVPN